MLYVSVRWSRLVEEKWRRSSGRMGRIVAIAAVRCAVEGCGHDRLAGESRLLSRCAGSEPIRLRSRRKPPPYRTAPPEIVE